MTCFLYVKYDSLIPEGYLNKVYGSFDSWMQKALKVNYFFRKYFKS